MIKPKSCKYSLGSAWEKIIASIHFPYKYKSEYFGQGCSDSVWSKTVTLTKEDKISIHRTFRMSFTYYFPEFPFYYKPSVRITVSELNTNLPIDDKRICKEIYVKLPDLRVDFYQITEETKDSVAYTLNNDGNEINVKYILDNIKIAFGLLNSI